MKSPGDKDQSCCFNGGGVERYLRHQVKISLRLWHSSLCTSYYCHSQTFSDCLYPMVWSIDILEETTPSRTEVFHHKINITIIHSNFVLICRKASHIWHIWTQTMPAVPLPLTLTALENHHNTFLRRRLQTFPLFCPLSVVVLTQNPSGKCRLHDVHSVTSL